MIIDCPSCSRKLRVPDDLLGKQVKCPTCSYTFQASAAAESAPSSSATPPLTPRPATPLNLELDAPGDATQPTQEYPAPPGPAEERNEEKVWSPTPDVPATPSSGPQPAKLSQEATQLVPCPGCDKLIDRDVARCPYCGAVPEDYDEDDDRPWEARDFRGRRDAEPHRGALILTLGIISIVLVAISCGPIGLPLGIAAWVMGQKDLRKMRENVMDDEGMGLTQAGWICGIIGTILDSLCSLGLLVYFGFIFTMVNAVKTMPRTVPTAPPIKKGLPMKKAEADFIPSRWGDYLPPANC